MATASTSLGSTWWSGVYVGRVKSGSIRCSSQNRHKYPLHVHVQEEEEELSGIVIESWT